MSVATCVVFFLHDGCPDASGDSVVGMPEFFFFFFHFCCGPFGWRLCPSLLRLTSPGTSVCFIDVERGRFAAWTA